MTKIDKSNIEGLTKDKKDILKSVIGSASSEKIDLNKYRDELKYDLKKFIEENKEKIYKIAEDNTKRNKDGLTVLTKDDPWRDEDEWDKMFAEKVVSELRDEEKNMIEELQSNNQYHVMQKILHLKTRLYILLNNFKNNNKDEMSVYRKTFLELTDEEMRIMQELIDGND